MPLAEIERGIAAHLPGKLHLDRHLDPDVSKATLENHGRQGRYRIGISTTTLDPYSTRVAHAFERVGPAVAHIAAIDQEGRSRGIGSGAARRYLSTNNHVVAGTPPYLASIPGGRQLEAVAVGAGDGSRGLRLATGGRPFAALRSSAGCASARSSSADEI